ncbi:hypothetical protein ACFXNW_15010 [Nocardia sp. NPDC059180]|uniref:hypothetical protein n=1 Tax=Nocardia sp. NPDC059180 TaxID=3346761 RepID=UPI00369791BE
MSQPLRIDPDRVNTLISQLGALARTAREQHSTLKTGLEGHGEPWGADETGKTFAEGYEPRAEKSLEAVANLASRLAEASLQVSDSTANLYANDSDSALDIRNADPIYLEWDYPQGPAGPTYQTPEPGPAVEPGPTFEPGPGTNVPTDMADGSSPSPADSGRQSFADGTDPNPPFDVPADQPFDYVPEVPDPSGAGFDPTADPVGYPGSTDSTSPDHSGAQADSPGPATPSGGSSGSPSPGDRAAAKQGRTPSAQGTPTPAPWRDTSAAASPTSGPAKPTDSAARTAGGRPSAETPWSRPQSGTPWGPGGPRPQPPGMGPVVPPGQAIPPRRPGKEAGAERPTRGKPGKSRRSKRETAAPVATGKPTTNAAALAAAQALAARHNLRLSGFNTSGIAEHTVVEVAAAVDDILGKYPFLVLGGIEITTLADGAAAEVIWDRDGTGPWISLDSKLAADPDLFDTTVKAATRAGRMPAGSEQRPIYATVVHALGRILVAAAGPRAQQLAQRSLITEYRRISGPWDRGDTLAVVVGGYRNWRAQLGPNSFQRSRFHPLTALETAFTEVELRGDDASGPAKALHRLAVEIPRGRPGGG